MPKPKTITKQQRKAIRNYIKKGYSANRIQKRLKARHMGMRRTVLLSQIRKVNHQKAKVDRLKYTPRKYQKITGGIPHPPKTRRQFFIGRQVAVYGYARTSRHPRAYSARFEFCGNGKALFLAVKKAHEGIVPRKEWAFVKCSARDFLSNPSVYGERGFWTERPEVES